MAYKGQRVGMDDEQERRMGAMQFIQQRFKTVKPKEVQEYKSQGQFVSAMKDVLSESEVSSMYPSEVWEPQADRFLKNLWAKHSKKMATAKKPVPGSSRGSRMQMR
jgi:hypothetical protein